MLESNGSVRSFVRSFGCLLLLHGRFRWAGPMSKIVMMIKAGKGKNNQMPGPGERGLDQGGAGGMGGLGRVERVE